jgi:hypothetical protein
VETGLCHDATDAVERLFSETWMGKQFQSTYLVVVQEVETEEH